MIEIIPTGTFDEWQQALDTEFSKSAESFIRIGYLLKVARDTDILKDTPYANVIDYAKTRYGLDKTQVSRFIAINERFGSKEDDSTLEDKYKGFGYAKLALMLNMPDEIIEEISPDYSKSEIEDIKKEIDEEKKISDIEVLIEGKDERVKELNELEQVMRDSIPYQVAKRFGIVKHMSDNVKFYFEKVEGDDYVENNKERRYCSGDREVSG